METEYQRRLNPRCVWSRSMHSMSTRARRSRPTTTINRDCLAGATESHLDLTLIKMTFSGSKKRSMYGSQSPPNGCFVDLKGGEKIPFRSRDLHETSVISKLIR